MRASRKWWPLGRWNKNIGVSSSTRRTASLGGTLTTSGETTLGELRRFMKTIEQWPDRAVVGQAAGAVLEVVYFSDADPLTREDGTK